MRVERPAAHHLGLKASIADNATLFTLQLPGEDGHGGCGPLLVITIIGHD